MAEKEACSTSEVKVRGSFRKQLKKEEQRDGEEEEEDGDGRDERLPLRARRDEPNLTGNQMRCSSELQEDQGLKQWVLEQGGHHLYRAIRRKKFCFSK